MKKLISLILVMLMTFSLCVNAFAVTESKNTTPVYDGYPLVIVRGVDFAGLEYEENGEKALNVNASSIITALFKIIYGTFIDKDKDAFMKYSVECVNSIFKPISNNLEGESYYDNVIMKQYPLSVDNYPEFIENAKHEGETGIMLSAIDKIGAENVYYFTYDWRRNPLDIAKELDAVIKTAKSASGKNKVNIACVSMGGMITCSYLYSYGYSSINNLVFISSAHNGTYVCGETLGGNIYFSGDTLYNYSKKLIGNSNMVTDILFGILKVSGIFNVVAALGNLIVETNKEYIFGETLRDIFGLFYGFWGICPDEMFDSNREFLFANAGKEYDSFVDELDNIRNFVFSTEKIIDTAYKKGIKVSFIAGYNTAMTPISKSANHSGDGVIETELMSNFAKVAPIGSVIEENELALSDMRYVSADRIIDASSLKYRDYTWFVKNGKHVGAVYGSEYSDFAFWLILNDKQPTVTSNVNYPQFLNSDANNSIDIL